MLSAQWERRKLPEDSGVRQPLASDLPDHKSSSPACAKVPFLFSPIELTGISAQIQNSITHIHKLEIDLYAPSTSLFQLH